MVYTRAMASAHTCVLKSLAHHTRYSNTYTLHSTTGGGKVSEAKVLASTVAATVRVEMKQRSKRQS